MIVDDNPEFLNGLKLTLEMEDFKVWAAINGQQALNKLENIFRSKIEDESEMARLPDLILADIMMPVMDGYAFYEHVQKNPYLNHILFVFLTAKDDVVDIRYGKELGSDDYIPKLTPTEDLLASIRGKLIRAKQQQAITSQFTWNPSKPLEGRGIIFIVFTIGLIALAFCLGFVTAVTFTGY